MTRQAKIARKTKETDISLEFSIDGNGASTIDSGNGFMDHMLTLFAKHGLFDLKLKCKGDIEVDFHHSAEDIGICLGQAVKKSLSDMRGIIRYATSFVPMDESLARVCLDICGRANLIYEVQLIDRKVSNFECDLVEDFFKAFSDHAQITLHVDLIRGRNSHHSIEAIFKAFARALSQACEINSKTPQDLPTTKGML